MNGSRKSSATGDIHVMPTSIEPSDQRKSHSPLACFPFGTCVHSKSTKATRSTSKLISVQHAEPVTDNRKRVLKKLFSRKVPISETNHKASVDENGPSHEIQENTGTVRNNSSAKNIYIPVPDILKHDISSIEPILEEYEKR